jgi:hypothetical protein
VFDRFRRQRGERGGGNDEESVEELRARAEELQFVLGRAPIDEARVAAIERLNELHAAGTISEEDFAREKRRLEDYGKPG